MALEMCFEGKNNPSFKENKRREFCVSVTFVEY